MWVGGGGSGVWGSGENKAAYCLLPIAYCLLPIAYCPLPIAYCLLPIAFCLLPIAFCLLPSPVPCPPSSQWSLIFDKLSFDELAQPIR
jgi:hypothetical protein